MPRILPLVGVAVGGVLAINALAGAGNLPDMLSGAKAFAEEAAKPAKVAKRAPRKAADTKAADAKAADAAPTGEAKDTASTALPPPTIQPKGICAPTAAELAKEAGLSPAELQVLQNLGARRGQLDQREEDLSTQLALLAAAEAKLDAKTKVLTQLKTDVQALLAQADGREAAEVDRLVKVYEGMKPQDAAARMAALEDSVRLPIAAKMKERALAQIIGKMPVNEAKKLTEALSHRFAAAQTLAQNASAKADEVASATGGPTASAAGEPAKVAHVKAKPRVGRKGPPRKKAPAAAEASAAPPADKPPLPAAAPAAAAPAPAKSG